LFFASLARTARQMETTPHISYRHSNTSTLILQTQTKIAQLGGFGGFLSVFSLQLLE